MNILLLGAAGFIGTNLTLELKKESTNKITLVDRKKDFFNHRIIECKNISIIEEEFSENTEFDSLLKGQELVYHLVSTTVPGNSNQKVPQELAANVIATAKMLEACVRCGVKKVIFISSGGTVYGKELKCPLREDGETNPINSYGLQKITIEKLLYLYRYMYGIDYRVVRLSNPYGPYQKPNGVLGAITTFTYKALKEEEIIVYGNGGVVRDFIYIDDAIKGIINIANGESLYRVFNLGCGYGTSINQVLHIIEQVLNVKLVVKFAEARKVDVPENYLDITRYEEVFGGLEPKSLLEGITNTASFIKMEYKI